jgi:predicted nucleotidyltransferase
MVKNAPVSVPAMFTTIAPATINIHPTTFAEVGLYKLRVEIYDYQPYSSFLYFDVKVINAAPLFLNKEIMKNKRMHFNNTYEYILPPYADPEGS